MVVRNDKVYATIGKKIYKGVIKDWREKSVWYKLSSWLEYQILTDDEQLFWIHQDNICKQ